ncbi:MAG: ATP-grasp domain-containing protein [Acidobacteriota bacterium]|nr:ATP-grasp domain-containing protein [Acidobacteriota bacterium]
MPLTRLLIANRGEIACRIIRACRDRGITSIAVYSDPDRTAMHARVADEAVALGGTTSAESYLRIDRLIEAARESGADAVHPGYGFLSERSAFARAVAGAGLIFVGPPADVIDRMGAKIEARAIAIKAGVPVVPGGIAADQSDAGITAAVTAVGYPALIKASAGGGGKGMRVARDAAALEEAIGAARREAEAAFGDGTLYVERLIDKPRHVEIQVMADAHGGAVHLFERDCSVQRRHQKVIEESPSPGLSARVRGDMGAAAVALAQAAGYVNAGTVEFLVEGEGDEARFYFLEMNTRLQVEHPVTEVVTGVDLVQAQLDVAAGLPLPWTQEALAQRGHAIECRIYAEAPEQGFLPQAGHILYWQQPSGPGVRVDAGFAAGSEVAVHYDPLLAKLIVSGATRDEAIRRALRALDEFVILGVRTNIAFLATVLRSDAFQSGGVHTRWVDDEIDALTPAPSEELGAIAAAASRAVQAGPGGAPGRAAHAADPWRDLQGWGR